MTVRTRPTDNFKSKDIDLICFLRFKSFRAFPNPIEDSAGTRWAIFERTNELEKAVIEFYAGNRESELLNEFRKTRSFLLDTPSTKESEIY